MNIKIIRVSTKWLPQRPIRCLLFIILFCGNSAISQVNADFEASESTIYVGQGIHYTDKSTNAVQWDWYFEGGNPPFASTQGPHYVQYLTAGTFEVSLTVMDVLGLTDSKSITISVLEPSLDYGDAPEVLAIYHYNTTFDENGARHQIDPMIFLGDTVDSELDGQPNTLADGDDLSDIDDEDGVQLYGWKWDEPNRIDVTVVGTGYLNAWIDLHLGGYWGGPNSHIIQDEKLTTGTHTFMVTSSYTPQAYYLGETYIRFRYSTSAGLNYNGYAPDGEVEDHSISFYPTDFGDAPAPYPTLLSDDGPRHSYSLSPRLGSFFDAEPNGQPHPQAQGDDLAGDSDEDGVVFFSTGTSDKKGISVKSLDDGGYFNAWIDFNMDGDWDDTDEHLFTDQLLNAGNQFLYFNIPFVPNQTVSIGTFARFRISTMPGLDVVGYAPDGEVEDYHVWLDVLDFGDAPDPPYTTKTGLGHMVKYGSGPHIWLGDQIDAEYSGQADLAAMGDDMDGNDDDDGIIFTSPIRTGLTANVTVIAHGDGKLSGWIDFDGDGDWVSPSEQIFTNISLSSGSHNLGFGIPGYATPKKTYARFRFAKTPQEHSSGFSPYGEIEDYLIHIVAGSDTADYGDAPDPLYNTLTANNGAVHTILPTIYLGSEIDGESDGQPDAAAMGDDSDGIDDDDGIVFLTPLIAGGTANIQITSTVGSLRGWVDFNGDGDWEDSGEKIISFLNFGNGTFITSFNVPMGAVLGSTFARFRLSSAPGLGPTGSAPDGEVEDYEVQIHPMVEGDLKWFQSALKNSDSPFLRSSWGWGELSLFGEQVIADDWFCHDDRPVTHIHWWGSYTEWDSIVPPPNAPVQFHIGIWTNSPNDGNPFFARPERLIKEWKVGRGQLNERVVGSNFVTGQMADPDSCFRYDFAIPQSDWFYQEGDSTTYWLSISSIYETSPEQHQWGWLTRDRYFNGDAVRILSPLNPQPDSLYRTGEIVSESWDMSFILSTTEYSESFDFGDAPDPGYATMLAGNGAHHIVWPGQYLGSGIDAEDDGLQDASAMGDDVDGSDDEDGVVFLSDLVQGQKTTIQATASMSGFLNAWIDFNSDGSWEGYGEHILIDRYISQGANYMIITVPPQANTESTFARFRFSPKSGASYNGLVIGGEVEDYEVSVRTEIKEDIENKQIPESFRLYQNTPNPFNPNTEIRYALPKASHVRLAIYNLSGQEIRVLAEGKYSSGLHTISWDAKDNYGKTVPAGIYIYRIVTGEFIQSKKLLLVK